MDEMTDNGLSALFNRGILGHGATIIIKTY